MFRCSVVRKNAYIDPSALDATAALLGASSKQPLSHQTGARGEEEAYFHLRKLGYVMVARNFRSPRRRGEIDPGAKDRGAEAEERTAPGVRA